jgi:hypothetical protein
MRLRNDRHPDGLDVGPTSAVRKAGVGGGRIEPLAPTSGVEAQRRYKARQKERLERELAGGAMGAGEMTVT